MSLNIELYRCDPDKNERCAKTGCYIYGGPCVQTTHAEYAMNDEGGHPLWIGDAVRNEAGDKEVHVFCEKCDHHYDYSGVIYCRRLGDRVTTSGGYCHHGIRS